MPPQRRATRRNPNPPVVEEANAGNANPDPPLAAAVVPEVVVPAEDFGRDKDLKNLLRTLQLKHFTGEGEDVPKILEEWIMSMED